MKIKKSISNIAWTKEYDEIIYEKMKKLNFSGIEIAPTRLFPILPYDRLKEGKNWAINLQKKYGFIVSSMQSIWYGKKEKLFGTKKERRFLTDYTKKAIIFAEKIGCNNLVFGCPINRNIPQGRNVEDVIDFFREVGNFADTHNTVIGIEPNPKIYKTNFINETTSAIELVKKVDSKGIMINVDLGAMIENKEDVSVLFGCTQYISHVHLSEPGLKPIKQRNIHHEIYQLLKSEGYNRFVSIEMGQVDSITDLEEAMIYIKEVFKD